MPRHLEAEIGDNWAEFSGWRTRELYTTLFRRPPIYNTRTRRWVTVPDKLAELIAAAEHEGWTVTVQRVAQTDAELSTAVDSSKGRRGDQFDDGGLW